MSERPKHALSLRQPWATAVVLGGKDVENRTWPTSFRGPVIIHAAQAIGMPGWDWEPLNAAMEALLGAPLPRGAFIGEVEIVDCVAWQDWKDPPDQPNPWASGPYCWVLRNPVAYPEPRPARGKLGIFRAEETG